MASVEERVTAAEQEITKLREQLNDTQTLAAHADRDVARFRSELRAQTQLLNANRLDVAELKGDVAELKGDVAELKGDVAELKGDVAEFKAEVREGFAKVNAGMSVIVELLRAASDGRQ